MMPMFGAGTSARVDGRRRGFTLVELIIVTAVIALVAAAAAPRFTGWLRRTSVEGASGHLALVLRRAHNQAAVTGARHRLVLDMDRSAYVVLREDEEGRFVEVRDEGQRRASLARGVSFKDVVMPSGRVTRSGSVTIDIFPKGFMDEVIVHIGDDSGRVRSVMVRGWLGRVKVLDGYRGWDDAG